MEPSPNSWPSFFWRESRGLLALYLLSFVGLAVAFFFLDGFQTGSGLLYFLLLSGCMLGFFLLGWARKKRKEFRLRAEQEASWHEERQKAALYEQHYRAHLLFINRWVHYIKTPLSVVRAISQEATTPDMMQIQVESDRILEGVNAALQFARATDFAMDFKIETFDVRVLFEELINELKMSFIRTHTYPELLVEEGLQVCSDRKWLKFIFYQLLTNAIKYSNPEGRIRIGKEDKFLYVQDEGIGIAPEDLPRIFDIFYTGTNGRTRGESTGIGLYLVKNICNQLGYSVSAFSVPPQGGTLVKVGVRWA